jgi:hypothetical protein
MTTRRYAAPSDRSPTMKLSHPRLVPASVRLFPRLANKPSATVQAVRRRAAKVQNLSATLDKSRMTKDEVRVRLLKMIVDNERTRRNEHHAS